MALVKTSRIAPAKPGSSASHALPPGSKVKGVPRRKLLNELQQDTIAERIAAATEELASGLAEASTAANELRSSMEQIASGAEEAAGASQQQLVAMKRVFEALRRARIAADASRRRTETAQSLLVDTGGQIGNSTRAIERNALRQ